MHNKEFFEGFLVFGNHCVKYHYFVHVPSYSHCIVESLNSSSVVTVHKTILYTGIHINNFKQTPLYLLLLNRGGLSQDFTSSS